jgi:hypothetical protein
MSKPAAPKSVLYILSGMMWVIVGVFLNRYAYFWLQGQNLEKTMILIAFGLILAFLIHFFGFSRVVTKNSNRIIQMPKKPCVFGFMSWKSYLIVIFMMVLGISLKLSPIPKPYLSILYIGIGTALILSGSKYFVVLFKQKTDS